MMTKILPYIVSVAALACPNHAGAQSVATANHPGLAMAYNPGPTAKSVNVTLISEPDASKLQPAIATAGSMFIQGAETSTSTPKLINRPALLFGMVANVSYTEEDMQLREYWGSIQSGYLPDGKLRPVSSIQTAPQYTGTESLHVDFMDDELASKRNMKVLCSNLGTERVSLLVKDASGNVIHQKDVLYKGRFVQRFDLSGLDAGIYYFEVTNGATTAYNTVFVQ